MAPLPRAEIDDAVYGYFEPVGLDVEGTRAAVSASVEEFDHAERLPIAFPIWVLLAAGLAVTGSAGLALVLERRRKPGRGRGPA